MRNLLRCLVLLVLGGCRGASSPAPDSGDGAPSSSCAAACQRMTDLRCPNAIPSTCASTLAELSTWRNPDGGRGISCACLAAAESQVAVTACGVACE